MDKTKLRVINIKDKTRYKLMFLHEYYSQRLPEMESQKKSQKANITKRELEIIDRLLKKDPVTGIEYQIVMIRMNKTVKDEQAFNDFIRTNRAQERGN